QALGRGTASAKDSRPTRQLGVGRQSFADADARSGHDAWKRLPTAKAHWRQWSAAELPSSAALCWAMCIRMYPEESTSSATTYFLFRQIFRTLHLTRFHFRRDAFSQSCRSISVPTDQPNCRIHTVGKF